MSENIKNYSWSVEQYTELIGKNIIQAAKLELLNGQILEFLNVSEKHNECLNKLQKILEKVNNKEEFDINNQKPYTFEDHSLLSPDLSLSVKDKPQLLIEISDDSIKIDQDEKLPIYATNKIPEYWIINLNKKQIEIYKKPVGEIYLVKNRIQQNEVLKRTINNSQIQFSLEEIL